MVVGMCESSGNISIEDLLCHSEATASCGFFAGCHSGLVGFFCPKDYPSRYFPIVVTRRIIRGILKFIQGILPCWWRSTSASVALLLSRF